MTIMFDLDGTWGMDPDFWYDVAQKALSRGHKCVMITARSGTDDDEKLMLELGITALMPVLYAGTEPKRRVARANGFEVDVWIDDNPILVDYGTAGLVMVGEQH